MQKPKHENLQSYIQLTARRKDFLDDLTVVQKVEKCRVIPVGCCAEAHKVVRRGDSFIL
jgi:hypothetical protein